MILGIETSTTHASLALLDRDSDEVVWQSAFESQRAHNAVIFEPVTEMLDQYRDRLSEIVVGLGPGSYGGVRVGIAVANGLSLVLGVPVRGASSLEGWDLEEDSYTLLGDARRKTIFLATVEARRLQGEPELLDEEDVEERLVNLRERGMSLSTADPKVSERWAGVTLQYPTAVRLLRAAAVSETESSLDKALEPHYLRAPYITTPKKRPLPGRSDR